MKKNLIALTVWLLLSVPCWAQTTIFSASLTNSNPGNTGYSFATEVTTSGSTSGKISVQISLGNGPTTSTWNNVYICQAAVAPSCSDTPVQVLFGGSGTLTISSGAPTATSDFVTYVTSGTSYIVCLEGVTGGDIGQNATGGTAFFKNATGLCSSGTRTSWTASSTNIYGVSQIQTEAGAAATSHNLLLLGVGQ